MVRARVRIPVAVVLLLASLAHPVPALPAQDGPGETLLLQDPSVSAEHVAFSYADDLWIVGREGGTARRLTSGPGDESNPRLSPDGKWVAFTGQYEGNSDVFVMPVGGGVPRRLTFHPGADVVRGWTPDGSRILFLTGRDTGPPVYRPALVSPEGGMPEMTSIPKAVHVAYRGDGKRIAYTPIRDAFRTWKRYRGGRAGPVWIYDPGTHAVEEVPHGRWTDTFPCWVGDSVYFASDRDGQMNIHRYLPGSGRVEPVTRFREFGVRNMGSGGGVVVFEQAGALHLLDPATGESRRLRIRVVEDGLGALPRWQPVRGDVRDADPAPNGKRAVFEGRGEILTLPKENGDPRNLTESPGAHDRSPAWSPDGRSIAWFSDEGGEYRLVLRDHRGREEPKRFDLDGAGFYHDPRWSPDGKRILYTDKGNRIAYLTVEDGKITEVARRQGSLGEFRPNAVWSPDSQWIAFEARNPDTTYDSIALHEVATGKTSVVTDGFGAAFGPAFSRDGKHLFFAASVDSGPKRFGLDMTASTLRPSEENLYLVVLKKDGENPLAPKSDEGATPKKEKKKEEEDKKKDDDRKEDEKKEDERKDEDAEKKGEGEGDGEAKKDEDEGKEGKDDGKDAAGKDGKKAKGPSIDLDGIDQRILALPGTKGEFRRLECTKDRLLFVDGSDGTALKAYDLDKGRAETLEGGVDWFRVSGDGKSLLYRKGGSHYLSDDKAKGGKRVDAGGVMVRVDPREEWPQILREVWRIQRDYFYDPAMHGVDWDAMWERWSAFLPHVRHRDDLNLLIGEMIGELCCGHEYVWGGEKESAPRGVPTGLLGADFVAEEGRFRIARIYRGQNWNPGLRAPLTEPGVDAEEGDYLISVDGRPVTAAENLHAAFLDTAGRQVEIALSKSPDGTDARTSTVVPLADDGMLRRLAWVEDNRRRVDELSGGRLAYCYMPNTGGAGIASFDRDFFSQIGKEGLVLDERYNGGGKVADYVIEILSREVLFYWMTREGWVGRTPFATMTGPKVMIINESAGSGGDAMPWLFRAQGIGPLVGTRTWGGLVGISGYPVLVDGGGVTAASFGVMDPEGSWIVENEGVAPDHEVVEYPADAVAGRDPQLEKAVQVALEALETAVPERKPEYHPPKAR